MYKEKVYGKIDFPDKIDITDPSYDEDIWCRVNNFPIPAGQYECYVVIADNETTHGWGDRVAKCGIRKGQYLTCERKAMIGVDSGMAGFFNCDSQKALEEIMDSDYSDDAYLGDNYFCSSSGYGDGGYDVYAGYFNGEIVDVWIEFI